MEETMKNFEQELEESYKNMGDGETSTDEMIAWNRAKELLESKEAITVTVTGVVKGGVVADFEGLRAFIPASRVSLQRIEDLDVYLNKEITVRVITADKENNKLVLSAREILREEQNNARAQKIAEVKVGSVLTGKVETIKDYGAFIDLGEGVSGLLHVSQISRERVKTPADVLQEGQEVTVKVTAKKDGKISLSMKALEEEKKEAEEVHVKIPKAENIGTSLGDLLKNIKL